eukprot:TRINITY_DN10042_c0_g1_i9.p1 TRINITY_DN10042_c0_g1~~TRINITY_DN10042_c0_g1_i9.p1  ORF type:complete len:737 (+),score=184.45 TRINITY_DN10042_c0_g1_i9:192-2402(+)
MGNAPSVLVDEVVLRSGPVQKKREETLYPGPTWQKRELDLVRVHQDGQPHYMLAYRRVGKSVPINRLYLSEALCQVGSSEKDTFRVRPHGERRIYVFKAADNAESAEWVDMVKKAIAGELDEHLPAVQQHMSLPPPDEDSEERLPTTNRRGMIHAQTAPVGEHSTRTASIDGVVQAGMMVNRTSSFGVSQVWNPPHQFKQGPALETLSQKKMESVRYMQEGGKFKSGWMVLDTVVSCDRPGPGVFTLFFFDKNRPKDRAVAKKPLLMGEVFDAEEHTKKKHTVGLRNHGELAVFVSFSSAAHCSAWMELLVNSMPPVEHLKSQVDQYVGLEARMSALPAGLAFHEALVRCLHPVAWRAAGAWEHASTAVSLWGDQRHILAVDSQNLVQYAADSSSMEYKVAWSIGLFRIKAVHVYQNGRFDLHFVDCLPETDGTENAVCKQMAMACCAENSKLAWRFADAVVAATSEAVVDLFEAVDEVQSLRLLFKEFIVYQDKTPMIDTERFVSKFPREYGYKIGKKCWDELNPAEKVQETGFLRTCVNSLEVRHGGQVVANDAAGRRIAGWMLETFAQVQESTVYVYDKTRKELTEGQSRACEDSDGEPTSTTQELPNPKYFTWIHDWTEENDPVLFGPDRKQYAPKGCRSKHRRRCDTRWEAEPRDGLTEARKKLYRVMGHRILRTADLQGSVDVHLLEIWAEAEKRRETVPACRIEDMISNTQVQRRAASMCRRRKRRRLE